MERACSSAGRGKKKSLKDTGTVMKRVSKKEFGGGVDPPPRRGIVRKVPKNIGEEPKKKIHRTASKNLLA